MRVGIIGATGFVGRHLAAALLSRGDGVTTASLRDPPGAAALVRDCDIIVNLAGEPIAQRWTPAVKERLRSSRVDATRALIASLAKVSPRASAYISASAIGYYRPSLDATYDESSPRGDDFLGDLCAHWERAAYEAESFGMRVALVRTGIALGRDGGALAKMLLPFELGLGGTIGDGAQWMSWIHIDDLVGVYLLAIDGASGALNATAPEPVTNAEFTHALGRALHRPTLLPVPTFALRAMLGEGASMLLTGARVLPKRLLELGYGFRFNTIDNALRNLVGWT